MGKRTVATHTTVERGDAARGGIVALPRLGAATRSRRDTRSAGPRACRCARPLHPPLALQCRSTAREVGRELREGSESRAGAGPNKEGSTEKWRRTQQQTAKGAEQSEGKSESKERKANQTKGERKGHPTTQRRLTSRKKGPATRPSSEEESRKPEMAKVSEEASEHEQS